MNQEQRPVLVAHPGAELYGSDRVLLESVTALVNAGRRVVVALPADGPLIPRLASAGAVVVRCPSPVIRKDVIRPSGFVRFVKEFLRGVRFGSSLIRRTRPEVIYVNTITVPLWLVLAKVFSIPAICHVHEGESSASPAVRRALALPLLLAERVVVNSRFSAQVIESSFPAVLKRVFIVYNGVPGPPLLVPPRVELDGPLRVVFLGRLSPRKGVDVAIAAIALLRKQGVDCRLDIFGAVFPGYEWYEHELYELVEELDLRDEIEFHGFHDSVWEGVAAGDVVVVPSTTDEPFGNTAVEAVLGGRPVIASATSGLLEAVDGYRAAQLVRPNDAAALASALRNIQSSWSHWRGRSEADIRVAEVRHSPAEYRRRIVAHVFAAESRRRARSAAPQDVEVER